MPGSSSVDTRRLWQQPTNVSQCEDRDVSPLEITTSENGFWHFVWPPCVHFPNYWVSEVRALLSLSQINATPIRGKTTPDFMHSSLMCWCANSSCSERRRYVNCLKMSIYNLLDRWSLIFETKWIATINISDSLLVSVRASSTRNHYVWRHTYLR